MFTKLWNTVTAFDQKLEDIYWSTKYAPPCLHCVMAGIKGRYCLENKKSEITQIVCKPATISLLIKDYADLRRANPNAISFDLTESVVVLLRKGGILKPGMPVPSEKCLAVTCSAILAPIYNNAYMRIGYREVTGDINGRKGANPHLRHDICFSIPC